jgi:hypothetical protein
MPEVCYLYVLGILCLGQYVFHNTLVEPSMLEPIPYQQIFYSYLKYSVLMSSTVHTRPAWTMCQLFIRY